MRIKCKKCGVVKDRSSFGSSSSRCLVCRNKRIRELVRCNPRKYKDMRRSNRERINIRNKINIYRYLEDHKCNKCGESDPIVLQFHHVGNKDLGVSEMLNRSMSWNRIHSEIKKCEVLCANCHARITSIHQSWYKTMKLDESTIDKDAIKHACMSRGPRSGCSSKYKGVSFVKTRNRWMAQIYVGKPIKLGLYKHQTDAALAYNEAARKYFGKYAYLNVV